MTRTSRRSRIVPRLVSAMIVMFAYFGVPIPWSEVVKRTVKEIGDDNCLGLAAQLAFYFLMALFPALLFLVALIGYLPVENALSELLAALGTVAPQELVRLLRGQLAQIAEGSQASLLTLGIIGAIWSSSAAMVAIIDALNRAYDVTEWRPWWKRRLLAMLLTVALALFIIIALDAGHRWTQRWRSASRIGSASASRSRFCGRSSDGR